MSAGQPRLDDARHALRGLMPTDALAWYEYLRRDDVTRDTSWTRVTPQRVAELIAGYGVASALEATEEDLMHTVFAHPTLSEALHESVLAAFGRALHA